MSNGRAGAGWRPWPARLNFVHKLFLITCGSRAVLCCTIDSAVHELAPDLGLEVFVVLPCKEVLSVCLRVCVCV